MGASTGILLLDVVMRPFLKFGLKFPLVGFTVLFIVYGYIGYVVWRSTFREEQNM